MNKSSIYQSAAHFNATHDYCLEAALMLSSVVVRHAHLVQLARKEAADPQLTLPLDLNETPLP
jgi:hypothetical protein